MRGMRTGGVVVCVLSALWIACGGSSDNGSSGGVTPDGGTDSGGGGTDSGGGGNDSGGGTDSGGGGNDAGVDASVNAPEINVTFGQCTPLVPCGGDPIGAWKLSAGCIDESAFDDLKQLCPTATTSNVVIKARGLVTVTAATISRETQTATTATIGIPQACLAQVPGGSCQLLALGLTSAPPTGAGLDKATCTSDGAGGCNCNIEDGEIIRESSAYTVAGNTISTVGPPARTFDFCVDQGKFTYTETTQGATPGTFELTK
ncbi:MAG: hypothetical protein R3B36_14695 [Polyangiaceae bacterium]